MAAAVTVAVAAADLGDPVFTQLTLILVPGPDALQLRHVDAGEELVGKLKEELLDCVVVVAEAPAEAADRVDHHRFEAFVDGLEFGFKVSDLTLMAVLLTGQHICNT